MDTPLPKMDPQIAALAIFAERWQNASRNDAFGWGAGSATMARSHDSAKAAFIVALNDIVRTGRYALLADAIALLARYERRTEFVKTAEPV